MAGNENLDLNSEFTISNGDKVSLDRCEYYISQIEFTHDGGQVTQASNVWLLVDAFDQEINELGVYDINQLEAISFYIGVQMPHNMQDLTVWPSDHPLAPQNPSMHWGWASGYRFLAIEGLSGTGSADYNFEVHALGNDLYYEQSIPVSASANQGELNITIDANYMEAFNGIATAQGGITHGDFADAVIMLENFRDAVFSQSVLGISEKYQNEISMRIAPNPALGGESSRLLLKVNNVSNAEIQIMDITGKLVYSEIISSTVSNINLPLEEPGAYLISLKQDYQVLVSEKWIVN